MYIYLENQCEIPTLPTSRPPTRIRFVENCVGRAGSESACRGKLRIRIDEIELFSLQAEVR